MSVPELHSPITCFQTSGKLPKSPFAFKQYGQSGTWGAEVFPNLVDHVDELAFVHSCYTDSNNPSPSMFQLNSGMNRMCLPCVGSWISYGLGKSRFPGNGQPAVAPPDETEKAQAALPAGLLSKIGEDLVALSPRAVFQARVRVGA